MVALVSSTSPTDCKSSDDEEDEEAEKIKQERVAAYAAKKVQKASTYRQILGSFRSETVGRRDGHGRDGETRPHHRDGRTFVGPGASSAGRIRYLETGHQLRRRG